MGQILSRLTTNEKMVKALGSLPLYHNDGTRTVITADYDYMGRRAWKKVESITPNPETGEETTTVLLHHRYIYRGYLQIATCDLTRSNHPCLWLITWDPSQQVATRPLSIQKDGTWYCYGWDLTKNICEIYSTTGYIRTVYTYTPYGEVTASGSVTQPVQWSAEYVDTELGLVYYNYRYYNPTDGRWTRRDYLSIYYGYNSYCFVKSVASAYSDIYGLFAAETALAGGAAVAGSAAAATAAVVVVGIGLVVLTVWGISEIVNNDADEATVDEVESVKERGGKFNYDRCAELCMFAYNGCMGVEYYNKHCRPSAKRRCSEIYDACLLGCSGGKWPTETPGVRFY